MGIGAPKSPVLTLIHKKMVDLIEYIVKGIVSNPDQVSVKEEKGEGEENEGLTIYMISVSEEDKGVLIGKKGHTINAIRDIVKIKAIKENKKVYLKVE